MFLGIGYESCYFELSIYNISKVHKLTISFIDGGQDS
jgi:hypothetical protein